LHLNDEIQIAVDWIKRATGCGAEDIQTLHSIAKTEKTQRVQLLGEQGR
jgi:hypothetical protein